MSATSLPAAFRAFHEDVAFGVGYREGICLPCNLPRRPEPAYTGSPMEHPKYLFSLIHPKSNGHSFPTRAEAEKFSSEIKESRVHSRTGFEQDGWVVQVGPWMFAADVRERKYP
jgi:hypothetical protein